MDNDFLIPLLVTLVTAMMIGAIYLLTLLVNDGQPDRSEEETLTEYIADQGSAPVAQADANADADGATAPAEAKQT
ncbi:MAG: hypothetical protein ACKO4M_05485 [Betaproteobacteria bacterium]